MFGLFSTPEKQMRENARNWIDLADRVYCYRRDVLADSERAELQKKTETLRAQLRGGADAGKLKLSIEALEPALRGAGGRHYPRSGMMEWVEFFIIGFIVILALRQFFFQVFQIPTNSMWPSYNGMVSENYASKADEPGSGFQFLRGVVFGSTAYRVDAPVDGEICIPVRMTDLAKQETGRQWLVFPQKLMRYQLVVGDRLVSFAVPEEFTIDNTIRDAFAPEQQNLTEMYNTLAAAGKYEEKAKVKLNDGSSVSLGVVHTGKFVHAGDRVISFDIIAGDRLIVDRISYHFVRPEVGSGFVFRTDNIPGTTDRSGNHFDSYYIKRLAGLPGDTLEIRPPVLYRNGAPITGAQAYEDNFARKGKYRGYFNAEPRYGAKHLLAGSTYTVSADGYFALGDNSANSQDSRYWGEVPKKDAVGRPLWIIYPFGSHWGPPH